MVQFVMLASPSMRGFTKATVPAREAALAGTWGGGKPWTPDTDAIRAALPSRLRKAFDRSGGTVWHDGTVPVVLGRPKPAKLYLTDRRGKPLYTLLFLLREEA